jgi:two-component system response regulator FlrC
MKRLPRVLVIDEERHQLDTVIRGLALYGYRCLGAANVEAGVEALAKDQGGGFDLVLVDLTTSGRSGLALIETVQERWPDLPIVAITGLAATAEIETVRDRKITLLEKPFGPDVLDAVIRRAMARD